MAKPEKRTIALALSSALVAFLAAEVVLRVQPWVDLDVDYAGRLSERLHHDEDRIEVERYGTCSDGSPPFRLLALGDSWMAEGTMIETIAREAADVGCTEVCNGGTVSYAPSLYLLKGRQLRERCSPDLIVVNIDATDVADEWYRYRIPQVRDRTGRLVAIPMSHDAHDLAFWNGIAAAHSGPSYVWRAVKKTYHLYVFMPKLRQVIGRGVMDYERSMSIHLATTFTPPQREQLAYFSGVLTEMTKGLGELVGEQRRVVVTYHPHFLGASRDPARNRYNDALSELLREVAAATGVTLVDCTGQVERIQGEDYGPAFQWPDDPFSHLTEAGYRAYGAFVAQTVVPIVRHMLDDGEDAGRFESPG